ncbi:MAG: AAA family ATPase [Prevotella sp.]|nr:AAA family ATPase [Prevotella sp.]
MIIAIFLSFLKTNSEFGERIVHPGQGYVYLKNASSGQQESIRILQDAFLSIYQGNKLLRIVEEPEAHLFPEAQMATIQLLLLMLNSSPSGHLILTTNSPYTLTYILFHFLGFILTHMVSVITLSPWYRI